MGRLISVSRTWVVDVAVALSASAAIAQGVAVPSSALATARALKAPEVKLEKGGEFEGAEFFEENDELLIRAWEELGPRHPQLYEYGPDFDKLYVAEPLRQAADFARAGKGEAKAMQLFDEVAPGVYGSTNLFTPKFLEDTLEELEHIQESGIPKRRPNGMNRYGVILDQVGLEHALQGFVSAYIRPLARMLFPELISHGDADEHYAFTVQYEQSGDTELSKHGDASVATLNLCLGRPGWKGGKLRFFNSGGSGIYKLPKGDASAGAGDIEFTPGMVVIHRGQHKHQALPIESGVRTNLVIWLMGEGGYVRVAPHSEADRLTVEQRWKTSSAPTASRNAERGWEF